MCFVFFFSSKLQQHDPHSNCFLRNMSMACIQFRRLNSRQILTFCWGSDYDWHRNVGVFTVWVSQWNSHNERLKTGFILKFNLLLKPWSQASRLCWGWSDNCYCLPWHDRGKKKSIICTIFANEDGFLGWMKEWCLILPSGTWRTNSIIRASHYTEHGGAEAYYLKHAPYWWQ